MQNFTEDQVKRQDFVDNEIYDLLKQFVPSTKEIEWNIEMIGDRQVPRKPRLAGGVKEHNLNDISFPGSPGLWPGASH